MFYLSMGRVLVMILVVSSSARSIQVADSTGALLYLSKFGYMHSSLSNPKTGSLIDEKAFILAIKEFQAFAKLNITGILDVETRILMNTPRCGVQDKIGFGANAKRKKRYALQGSRWRVRNLTYKIVKYPMDLTTVEVDRDLRKAFEVWEEATDLTFNQIKGKGKIHIEIRFEKSEHGDGDPFDGPGGTLAHAFFPIYGGDAHFDQSEAWTVESSRGTNLFQVAAHEFGHSLGLSHSDIQTALMAPFYRGFIPNFKLDKDDVRAIQSLYGESVAKPTQKTDEPADKGLGKPNVTANAICSKKKLDAIVTMGDEKTYAFIGSQYWQLLDDGIAKGYPRDITKDFDGLEANLDAAFTWTDSLRRTYFFKGAQYWRFTDQAMDDGYPKKISSGFAGIPDNIDAVFIWSGNGKIYFFKGNKYWRFDTKQLPPVRQSYPRKISNWKGIPNNVDDALQYSNGYTYFFKDGKYWRFNDRAFTVDKAEPPFPRQVNHWWFGCPKKSDQKYHETKETNSGPSSSIDDSDISGDRKFDADGMNYMDPYPSSNGDDRSASLKEEEQKRQQNLNNLAPNDQDNNGSSLSVTSCLSFIVIAFTTYRFIW